MRPNKAIAILENLKASLSSIDINSCQIWKVQMQSYVLIFFGEGSPKYKFITTFQFYHYPSDYTFEAQVEQNKKYIEGFINDCIDHIKNFGVKKKEWKHIILTTHPALFWTIFSAGLICAFWIGVYFAKNEGNQAPTQITENKNDSTGHKR